MSSLLPLAALIDTLAYNYNTVHTPTSVALSATAVAALLLRHRAPEAALLLSLPGCCLGYLFLAPLIALYCVAARRASARLVWVVAAVTVLISGYYSLPSGFVAPGEVATVNAEGLAGAWLECGVPAVFAVMLGRSVRARREQLRAVLERRKLENRLLAERVLAAERARLAREMHDVVSHKVGLISLQAGALQVGRPGEVDVRESARRIHELSAQTVTELHHMLGMLRTMGDPATADELHGPGLADLAELVRTAAVPVRLDMPERWQDVPRTVERAAYRTAQEALTNIRKHAPGAHARVAVTVSRSALRIEVSNSPGSKPRHKMPGAGQGLVGLAERARLLDGDFTAGPRPGGGFQVVATYRLAPDQTGPEEAW